MRQRRLEWLGMWEGRQSGQVVLWSRRDSVAGTWENETRMLQWSEFVRKET